MYIYSQNTLTAEEWQYLRTFTDWPIHSLATFSKALDGSLFTISVYHDTQIIAMGRLIGDCSVCFYLQDIIVLPQYQKQGIGHSIVKHILQYISNCITNPATVALMSSKGSEPFYENLGFEKREGSFNGYGMELIIYPN